MSLIPDKAINSYLFIDLSSIYKLMPDQTHINLYPTSHPIVELGYYYLDCMIYLLL